MRPAAVLQDDCLDLSEKTIHMCVERHALQLQIRYVDNTRFHRCECKDVVRPVQTTHVKTEKGVQIAYAPHRLFTIVVRHAVRTIDISESGHDFPRVQKMLTLLHFCKREKI